MSLAAARAGSDEATIQDGHRRFAADYVAAVNSRDVDRLRRLTHPSSLQCISDENRDFFDEFFARDLRRPLTGPFHVADVSVLPGDAPPIVPPDLATYPVPPTHRIQIDVRTSATSSVRVLRDLRLSDGAWLVVMPCPTAKGLEAFRAAKRKAVEQEARAAALVAELKEPLRSELTGLLREGQRIEAMKRYSAVSGEDLAMAKRVIDLLESAK